MAAMRSGLVHLLAWSLATGAAVTLSWWGVHTVMAGTAYDPPRALPLTAGEATEGAGASEPPASGTSGPSPSPSGDPSPARQSRTPDTSSAPPPSPSNPSASGTSASGASRAAAPGGPGSSGEVKSYDTEGGRVVLDLGRTSASLVSATPGAGWSMQVWKTHVWIRVDFASGADRVTVFCTWHDGPPRVDVNTY
ncbi:hypothetical protein [Streptomyces sp. BK239]|uniref:hypothetical protein n=1 Tax=Streptomyces sp. BK239 TaxID=2512155 RepID=UPI00102CD75E|nr:hypothetical protein [Streptomyces sp. BK239]